MQENDLDVKIKAKVQVACSRQRGTSSCVEEKIAYLGKNGVVQNYSHIIFYPPFILWYVF